MNKVYAEIVRHSRGITYNRGVLDNAIARRQEHISAVLAIHALNHICEGTWLMAKEIKKAKGETKKKAEFKGFANVDLSVEEKAEAREWVRNVEAVQVELDEMAASLYKLSFFKSEATGGYQATAFCMDEGSPNAGYILSSFAPHWFDALAMLAYKHAVRCEGVWPLDKEASGDLWG